ncbi:MAG: helix-turn-helix domain-containing protein, partial [Firmicutes bacterium]|nr:helix-turn-helix domain-containing protein [Bacillota bacterium]
MKKNQRTKKMTEDKRQNEIIRIQKKRNNFVMLDKGFLEDKRLSFKAKGILAYLLSKPDGWKVIVKDLINHSADGKKAIYSGLRELKTYGYYKKEPVRDESNRVISHWESVIYECPEEQPQAKQTEMTQKNESTEKNVEKSPVLPLLTPFVHIDNVEIQNGQRNNNYSSKKNNSKNDISINRSQGEAGADNQEP